MVCTATCDLLIVILFLFCGQASVLSNRDEMAVITLSMFMDEKANPGSMERDACPGKPLNMREARRPTDGFESSRFPRPADRALVESISQGIMVQGQTP